MILNWRIAINNFTEVPASKRSFSHRKLIYGIGINDADYVVQPILSGKRHRCPYYIAWSNMISRSYSERTQAMHPTYIGCSVTKEWLTFSVFKEWMKTQDWKGKELDKDLLMPGNKIYEPSACMFVSSQINSLLTDSAASRGGHPQGVCFNKEKGKCQSYCRANGKANHLGYFNTALEAEYTYLVFKSDLINRTASDGEAENNPKLKSALINHAKIFEDKSKDIKCILMNNQEGV